MEMRPGVTFKRCKMNLRFFVYLATVTVLLGAIDGRAQNADPPAGADLPDACKLMPQSDLEALFPGMSSYSSATRKFPIACSLHSVSACIQDWIAVSTALLSDGASATAYHLPLLPRASARHSLRS